MSEWISMYIKVSDCEKNNLNGMQMFWNVQDLFSRTCCFLLEQQTVYLSYLQWWLLSSSSTKRVVKRNYYSKRSPVNWMRLFSDTQFTVFVWRNHIPKLYITFPSQVYASSDKRPYTGTWRFTMFQLDSVLPVVIESVWISPSFCRRCVAWNCDRRRLSCESKDELSL